MSQKIGKRVLWLLGLLVLLSNSAFTLVVGVLEFEEKNSVGVENAGQIFSEFLIGKLKDINQFVLAERLFLNKMIDEQKLGLSGLTEEKKYSKIGKFFEVDALLVGSIMKVGSEYSITVRLIDASSSEILKSASVNFYSIDEWKEKLHELAFIISGLTQKDYLEKRLMDKNNKNRIGFKYGLSFALAFNPVNFGLFYRGKHFDFQFNTLVDLPDTYPTSIYLNLQFDYYFWNTVGLGLKYQNYIYNHQNITKYGVSGLNDSLNVQYLLLGASLRAFENLRFSVYAGYAIGGSASYSLSNNSLYYYVGASTPFGPVPVCWNLALEYEFIKDFSLELVGFLYQIDKIISANSMPLAVGVESREVYYDLGIGLFLSFSGIEF